MPSQRSKLSTFPFFVQRDFDEYWDRNRNGRLDEDEILRILHESIHISKACTTGLIRSCGIDGNPGISKQEWFTCFKTEGTSSRSIYITALLFLNYFGPVIKRLYYGTLCQKQSQGSVLKILTDCPLLVFPLDPPRLNSCVIVCFNRRSMALVSMD